MALRKALLVGINDYPEAPLRGCVNDVHQMKEALQTYYGFEESSFRVLIDDQATHAGIQAGLMWLAEGGDDPEAVRVFHYAGHGSYVADGNGDEPDGRDECIVPFDYMMTDMITDDILKIFYDRIPASGNLTLIMDSCHSGTVQRARGKAYRFLPMSAEERARADAAAARFAKEQWNDVIHQLRGEVLTQDEIEDRVRERVRSFEKGRFGDVRVREANVLLAGCQPDQQSADALIADDFHGAFTYYLCQAISEEKGQITYRELAERTGMYLDDHGYLQIPQLEYRGGRDQWPAFHPFSESSDAPNPCSPGCQG